MSLIILAGGNSTRLNTNKAFLELIDSKTVIENIVNCLKDVFREVIVVANKVEDYRFLGFNVVPDIIKGKGPLGGIYTGLKTASEERNFVLACDMPFVNVDLVRYMLKFKEFDAVVPSYEGLIEPLYAVYSKSILMLIENQLKGNNLKINETIKKIKKVKYIEKDEIERFDKGRLCFFNINNKEDLEKAKELIKKSWYKHKLFK